MYLKYNLFGLTFRLFYYYYYLHLYILAHSEFLMFMRQNQIAGVPFDTTPEIEGISDAFVPVLGIKKGRDFDYDSKEGVIYWVEYDETSKQGSIQKIKFNGENRTSFLSYGLLGAPYTIAIDWVSRNLYFGNMGASTIEVWNIKLISPVSLILTMFKYGMKLLMDA